MKNYQNTKFKKALNVILITLATMITIAAITGACLGCMYALSLLTISIPMYGYVSYRLINKLGNKAKLQPKEA